MEDADCAAAQWAERSPPARLASYIARSASARMRSAPVRPSNVAMPIDSAGARGVETVVAVAHEPQAEASVMSPCGMCRELISDFGLDAWVIIPSVDGPPRKVVVLDLLPERYTRVDASS
ncbi:MAG: cytidine deaminase [Solirubrobacteraceae bacterium]|nr:cytidine deaminase [Solirubrobacteraceae bacterium]